MIQLRQQRKKGAEKMKKRRLKKWVENLLYIIISIQFLILGGEPNYNYFIQYLILQFINVFILFKNINIINKYTY